MVLVTALGQHAGSCQTNWFSPPKESLEQDFPLQLCCLTEVQNWDLAHLRISLNVKYFLKFVSQCISTVICQHQKFIVLLNPLFLFLFDVMIVKHTRSEHYILMNNNCKITAKTYEELHLTSEAVTMPG